MHVLVDLSQCIHLDIFPPKQREPPLQLQRVQTLAYVRGERVGLQEVTRVAPRGNKKCRRQTERSGKPRIRNMLRDGRKDARRRTVLFHSPEPV